MSVAVLSAADVPRREIITRLGCTDLDFRAAQARLVRVREDMVDMADLMAA